MLKWVDMDRLSMYYIDSRYIDYRCMGVIHVMRCEVCNIGRRKGKWIKRYCREVWGCFC